MKGCERVLSIFKFNEYCNIFENEDFGQGAMDFFNSIGHSLSYKPYLTAEDIIYCIYFDLEFAQIFTYEEQECFTYIKQLSLLFELQDEVFDVKTDKSIKYYAVDLSVEESFRSKVAHTIHNAFSRESNNYTVIIFRNVTECMISISYGKEEDDNLIYLSDWISINSSVGYIEKIVAHNLSFLSSISFLSDFIYYSARDYYIYPISKEFGFSQISNIEQFRVEEWIDKDAIRKFIDMILYCHIDVYGDDYIEENNFNNEIESDTDKGIDFYLLELELDEYLEDNSKQESDEENELFVKKHEYEISIDQSDISNIAEYILNDPIELIKWIKNKK